MIARGVEDGMWKGADIKTAAPVLIPAEGSELVPFFLKNGNLPLLPGLDGVYPSVRSRFAQLGLNINKRAIPSGFSVTEVVMTNYGARAVAIGADVGVFRLFSYSRERLLRGSDLIGLVDRKNIKIEGQEGIEWEWQRDNDGIPIGMYAVIRPDSMRYIPSDPNLTPVAVEESIHDYRAAIDVYLQPAPRTNQSIFWIAETPKLTLPSLIDAVLDRIVVVFDSTGKAVATKCRQINSRLIDGGKTNWPLRVEILGPTTSVDPLAYVGLSFIQRRAFDF